jgi:hypothetical protein
MTPLRIELTHQNRFTPRVPFRNTHYSQNTEMTAEILLRLPALAADIA